MKPLLKLFGLICSLYIANACTRDFIVKNIKNDTVSIISPADILNTPNNLVLFWWNELDGAEKYNIQIVKPSFSSVSQLIADTNVTGNKFNFTFTPGTYQWRIKAMNAGGSTAYTTRTFIIDTTSNLNLITVSPVMPLNKSVTSNTAITFAWNPVATANTTYELILTSQLTSSVTPITGITTASYTYSFNVAAGNEETFTWEVKASNSFSKSLNTIPRSIRIDRKSPLPVVNISPSTYSMSIRDTVQLQWTRNLSSPDIHYDVVSLSDDSTFSYALGTKTITTGSSLRINDGIYTYTNTTSKPVWWTVTSVDSAGNVSPKVMSKRLNLR